MAQIEKELDTNNLEIKERTGYCQIEMNRKSKANQTAEWKFMYVKVVSGILSR